MREVDRVKFCCRLQEIAVVEKGRKMRGTTGNHEQKGGLGGLII